MSKNNYPQASGQKFATGCPAINQSVTISTEQFPVELIPGGIFQRHIGAGDPRTVDARFPLTIGKNKGRILQGNMRFEFDIGIKMEPMYRVRISK